MQGVQCMKKMAKVSEGSSRGHGENYVNSGKNFLGTSNRCLPMDVM